ncbi:MAG: fibronectin type III domain-containing protein [candidate division KSB1 bacterium]|nr:fibronectin type III domain-containing protein [candidate division KSB1 bacterium]
MNNFLKTLFFAFLSAAAFGVDMIGISNDNLILPPNLNTFNPPRGAGSSYVDPAFGTTIIRVTDNLAYNQFVLGGYYGNSEICYFNKDGSFFIALENVLDQGRPKPALFLYDGSSGKRLRMLAGPGSGLDPYFIRWALADRYVSAGKTYTFDPNRCFYFVTGNEIRLYDIDNMNAFRVLRRFSEYQKVSTAGGEGDLSFDGRFWVLDGDGRELFVYDLINDVKYKPSTFDLGSLGSKGGEVGVDYAVISPRGNYVIVSWGTDPGIGKRFAGIELYDKEFNFIRQLHPSIVHWDTGIDAAGDEVIFSVVTHDFPQFFASCGATPGDIVSVRLSDGRPKLLKDIPMWAHMTISACNTLTNGEYIFLSYQNRSSNPISLWSPFWDEVFAVKTDGSQQVKRFVHHRSHYVEGQSAKYYQPDAMVNRQGTRVLYRSTYNTGIGDLYLFSTVPRDAEPSDRTPPNPPVGLRQGIATYSSIELIWETPPPASDGDLPISYKLFRDGRHIADVYDTRYTDIGLTEAASYAYQLIAVDNAGNQSSAVTGIFSTAADRTPPTAVETRIINPQLLQIVFSERLDSSSASTIGNYRFDPALSIAAAVLGEDGRTVSLQTEPLSRGVQYRLTINNVTDASKAKNPIAPNSYYYFMLLSGFFDDFESGLSPAWTFKTPSRWQIELRDGNNGLLINTTEFGDTESKLLGEYALITGSDQLGNELIISCAAKSNEDLASNRYADYAVVFGFIDDQNYYYVQFQPIEVKLHRISGGTRTLYQSWYFRSDFERVNRLVVELQGAKLRVLCDGRQAFSYTLPEPPQGLIGLGSVNDSVWFDNVNIGPISEWDTTPPSPPHNLRIINQTGR